MSMRQVTLERHAFGAAPTIRSSFLAPLIRELDECGIEVDPFLRQYGLSATLLASLYERVLLKQYVAIAEDLAGRLRRPFLGLELGQTFSLADLGPFYAVFVLSGDLRAALGALARYQSAWQTDTTLDLVRGAKTSICRYLIQDPAIWPRKQDAEFSLASFTTLIRQLTGKHWHPVAVEFEHDVANRAAVLSRFFRAPVVGNCAANALLIANDELDQPLRARFDPGEGQTALVLERHLSELLGPPVEASRTCSERARELIARRLGRGNVTVDAIAAEMNMSVRSLRRHLAKDGSSFRKLLREHRCTMIETILEAEGARLGNLAGRVSYSDGTVLSRAFKTWTGMSPRQYTKKRKSQKQISQLLGS